MESVLVSPLWRTLMLVNVSLMLTFFTSSNALSKQVSK